MKNAKKIPGPKLAERKEKDEKYIK